MYIFRLSNRLRNIIINTISLNMNEFEMNQ